MKISRRQFARTVGVAIAATAATGAVGEAFSQSLKTGLYPLSAGAYGDRLMSLGSTAFQPFIGTIFHSRIGDGEGNSLRLVEVFQPSGVKGGPAVEGFSLLFQRVGRKSVSEETHTFEHPSLGTFSLFIAPVDRGGKIYEAVINHTVFQ